MANPVTLHGAVLAALRTVPNLEVHDGAVPAQPAADASGRVWPYLVVWAGAGWADPAARAVDHTTGGALAYTVRVTAAGGTPARALHAAHAARGVLDGLVLTTGASPLTEQPGPALTRDDDTVPARWYAPLSFTAQVP